MTSDQPDSDLLALSRLDPELMGVLYERHATAVYGYLVRRAGVVVAEDLLGEVFVAAMSARMRVVPHESGSALPWLYGIAGNVLRAHLRGRARQLASDEPDSMDWDAVDARLDAGVRRHELRVALSALSPAERELLLLVAWEGLTVTEAGAVLGLTPTAARSRLHRARARAQACLTDLTCTTSKENER